MANYQDYISFEFPQWATERIEKGGYKPSDSILSGREREVIEKALEELASTPEGLTLIREVAARFDDNTIHLVDNKGGWASITISPNIIAFGEEAKGAEYFSPELDDYHLISVQRILHHELRHIVSGHEGITYENEAEAVNATNRFMKKYYGEPFRDEDATNVRFVREEIPWHFNEGFKPEGYPDPIPQSEELRREVQAVDPDQISSMGPEIQSLYELKDNSVAFEQQYLELSANDGLVYVTEALEMSNETSVSEELGVADKTDLKQDPISRTTFKLG